MCGGSKDTECSPRNFLFSNAATWRLYSPENVNSKSVRVFYLVWRWFWALLFLATYILSIVNNISEGPKWLIYLTNWAYTVFNASQLTNAVVSTICFASKAEPEEMRFYMKLNWFLYELSQAAAVVITILYWALLFDPNDLSSVQVHTYFNHGVNGAFVLIDIWVTAMPIKALHFYIPTAFGLTWAIFALIYDFVGGTNGRNEPYIYQIFDWTAGATMPAIATVAAIAVVIIVHFTLFGFFRLRVYLYSRCSANTLAPIDGNTNPKYNSVEMVER
ncbi:hypothetical protein EB796_019118 [Bugula neritina]|uniref:Protein rolling stone n=1 Tax=Bugula neritina TaxID=10212 RepID=A0A7J7J8K2_BUGNE|nr:hypothetical protein EB796_019118 [Bugula neritina]